MRILLLIALLCTGMLHAQGMRALQQHGFDHYQVIIDRLPFGDAAEAAASAIPLTAQLAAEQKTKEEIAAKLQMCGLTVTPQNELCAAFIDSTVNPAINYFLTVGESKNGFKLISANRQKETATLLREDDGIQLTFRLGKGLVEPEDEVTSPETNGAAAIATEQPVAAPAFSRRRDSSSRRKGSFSPLPASIQTSAAASSGTPAPTEEDSLTYKERLAAREAQKAEDARAKKAAEETAREAARETALQDAIVRQAAAIAERREQIDRIKRGEAPTVPIKLTAEEDAELVQEGVFDQ